MPNNQWVRRLENETGLSRRKDKGDTFWFLPNKGVVYTIGYEGKTIEQFVNRLKNIDVQQLIDVRELALSRKNGFAKSALKKTLNDNGILYRHLPELGSPSQIRHKLWQEGDYAQFFKEYASVLEREESRKALADLEDLAHIRRTVIMCFEYDVDKCHRKIIKEHLISNGFGVVDL